MGWLDVEVEALKQRWLAGEISDDDLAAEEAALRRDAKNQEDCQSIIDAGRGHLVR